MKQQTQAKQNIGLLAIMLADMSEAVINSFGEYVGVTKETLPNGQLRYRLRDSNNAPGVWISQAEAYRIIFEYGYIRMGSNLIGLPRNFKLQ
ncbi:hypothetical protein HYW20_08090 [Candidatus Woesearchaeota archaeon]|nr:hypothetical protein [Candidatus Woesearchaeota archaeon]